MQYSVARGEKGKIEVKVDVSKDGFEEAYEQVLTRLGAQTNVAGFRPCKAPRDVILQHVGSNKILNQTASFLISKNLGEIFKKEDLVPIDSPKIAIATLAQASPFSFTASFTQKPAVVVGDWKKIKVKKVAAKEITEKDVAESVKNIFEAWVKNSKLKTQNSKVEEKEENKPGQFIYDAHGNRIPIKDDKQSFSTNKGSPTNAGDEIDDNFAKAIGARDLTHLRELVKGDLKTIVADQVESKLEQDVFEEILKIATLEVPDILVEDELNRILVRLSSELERQSSDLEKYLAQQKITIDELKTKWRPQAEKNVRITLVVDEIGRGEGVKVTKEELEVAFKNVNETNLSADQKEDLERYLALSIFQAKTLDLVKKAVAL